MIDLKQFFSFQNPNQGRYASLHAESYAPYLETSYGNTQWGFLTPEWNGTMYSTDPEKAKEFFREKLKGKPLIDLGCGPWHWAERLAEELDLSLYIGIDHSFGRKEEQSLERNLMKGNGKVILLNASILHAVAHLQSGAYNITINGIDHHMIRNEKYRDAIVEELWRALQPESTIFGCNSIFFERLKQRGFIQTDFPGRKSPEFLGDEWNGWFLERK
ncbi:MAG: class I SAM-dependent methyltransferase [bacterium]|nr:class I SAM-dependent methyltransferase [bacterium]